MFKEIKKPRGTGFSSCRAVLPVICFLRRQAKFFKVGIIKTLFGGNNNIPAFLTVPLYRINPARCNRILKPDILRNKKRRFRKNGSGVFRPCSAQQAGSDIGQDGRQQQRAAGDNRNNAHHLLLLLRLLVGLRSHWNRPPIVEIKHIIAQSYASAKGETQENWRRSVFGRFGARKGLTSPDAPHIIRRKGDERKSTCAGSEREGAPPAESAPRKAQREVHPRASGLRRQLRL